MLVFGEVLCYSSEAFCSGSGCSTKSCRGDAVCPSVLSLMYLCVCVCVSLQGESWEASGRQTLQRRDCSFQYFWGNRRGWCFTQSHTHPTANEVLCLSSCGGFLSSPPRAYSQTHSFIINGCCYSFLMLINWRVCPMVPHLFFSAPYESLKVTGFMKHTSEDERHNF